MRIKDITEPETDFDFTYPFYITLFWDISAKNKQTAKKRAIKQIKAFSKAELRKLLLSNLDIDY